MGEMALLTAAADRALRSSGVAPDCARVLVADLGWEVYSTLLAFASLPARLSTVAPGLRLHRTIRLLLRFPFAAPGPPGYAVDTVETRDAIHTHFTHCPPQTLTRALGAATNDPNLPLTFRESWCRYDWPGADLIAGDGGRDHYERRRTLSHGDPVCDMCWRSRALRGAPPDPFRHPAPSED